MYENNDANVKVKCVQNLTFLYIESFKINNSALDKTNIGDWTYLHPTHADSQNKNKNSEFYFQISLAEVTWNKI